MTGNQLLTALQALPKDRLDQPLVYRPGDEDLTPSYLMLGNGHVYVASELAVLE